MATRAERQAERQRKRAEERRKRDEAQAKRREQATKKRDERRERLRMVAATVKITPFLPIIARMLKRRGIEVRGKKIPEIAQLFRDNFILTQRKKAFEGSPFFSVDLETETFSEGVKTFEPATIGVLVTQVVQWISDAIQKRKERRADATPEEVEAGDEAEKEKGLDEAVEKAARTAREALDELSGKVEDTEVDLAVGGFFTSPIGIAVGVGFLGLTVFFAIKAAGK